LISRQGGDLQPAKISPYDLCPVYQSNHFIYRLVEDSDAEDLLICYSDEASVKLFNSDNCTSDFHYHTIDEMNSCIQFWLNDYARRGYVRFSIIDRQTDKVVGTIEFFARQELYRDQYKIGLLRLDLTSSYEKSDVIEEINQIVEGHLCQDFEVDGVITKVVPEADQRLLALLRAGYQSLPDLLYFPYPHYFIKVRE
jgi:[ribosomal protein S5]-alanine N-acetyltransferase